MEWAVRVLGDWYQIRIEIFRAESWSLEDGSVLSWIGQHNYDSALLPGSKSARALITGTIKWDGDLHLFTGQRSSNYLLRLSSADDVHELFIILQWGLRKAHDLMKECAEKESREIDWEPRPEAEPYREEQVG
jgi:hypothetical protein